MQAVICKEPLSRGLSKSTSESEAGCGAETQVLTTDLLPDGLKSFEVIRESETALVKVDPVLVVSDETTSTGSSTCLDLDSELLLRGKSSPAVQNRISDAMDCISTQCVVPHCGNYSHSLRDVHVTKREEPQINAREGVFTVFHTSGDFQEDKGPGKPHGIIIMSSLKSWVDMDSQNHCTEKCIVGCLKHHHLQVRSPLHRHFGYKKPSDLLEKIIFSEDEEMRVQTESDSTASSSSSPNTARQSTNVASSQVNIPLTPVRSTGVCELDSHSTNSEGRNAHGPLSRLFKRNWKKRYGSQVKLKGKVVVNGHVLSSTAVKQAEERAGKLCPGSYWYDCTAGFWGVEGGACRGILPPLIKEFSHPMVGNCANGDTQVYINGRELNSRDLAVLSRRGLPQKAGMAYNLSIDGVLVDETTGLEAKHLGNLAPTVVRRGKGFGMFAGNVPEVNQPAVPDKLDKGSQ